MPEGTQKDCLLHRYKTGLMEDGQAIVMRQGHRSSQFATLMLPRCHTLVKAIGHRMAYDAAVASGVPSPLVDLYVANVVKDNLAWYVEHGILNRDKFFQMEATTISGAALQMEEWVARLGVGAYVTAPIVSDARWEDFVGTLPTFSYRPGGHLDRPVRASL